MARERIFIVEDENIVAMEMAERLADLGYEVVGHARSGGQAVKKIGQSRPDLVLMDIVLKGDMDGIDATEQIRSHFDTPVVYVTAHADPATLARAKITGPFGYIVKPFNERELSTSIEIALYRHQMEKKLREREQWLSTTLESIGDAVIAADSGSHITFVNPVAQALTGWGPAEIVGRSITEVFNIMSEEPGRGIRTREGTLISKDGQELAVEYTASPTTSAGGDVSGVVVVFRDISQRKRTEERLRQAKDYAENVIAAASAMIISLDNSGCTRVFNDAAQKITGYTRAELQEKNWLEVLAPKESCPELWEMLKGWESGKPRMRSKSLEAPIITKRGERRLISWRHSEISEGKTVVGLISFGIDSGGQKAVEEDVRDTEMTRSVVQLATEVAHDFDNILTTIVCYSHLLNMQVRNDASLSTYVDRIIDSSDRAALLVRNLLLATRKEQGKAGEQ